MSSHTPKDLFVFAKREIDGVTMRPDARAALRKGVDGQTIVVSSASDYINLHHVFRRMQTQDKTLARYTLARRQVGPSLWHLFIVRDRTDVPTVELADDYDPKRGRYKRYADQLSAGDALHFTDKAEAVKAARAWRHYVPRKERKNLGASTRRVRNGKGYLVTIVPRERD